MNKRFQAIHKLTTILSTIFLGAPLLVLVASLFIHPYTALAAVGLLSYAWFMPAMLVIFLLVLRRSVKEAGKDRARMVLNIGILIIILIDLVVFANVWRYV